MRECHVVSGPPAAGKTTEARRLAGELGACLLDSDEVADRLVASGLSLAGLDPDDRDSAAYKDAFREAVYETLFDLAVSNLPVIPVVIAGPFSSEGADPDWPRRLRERLGVEPWLHFVWCDPEERRRRMKRRGAKRDLAKLGNWEGYVGARREELPVWPHRLVDSGGAGSSSSR